MINTLPRPLAVSPAPDSTASCLTVAAADISSAIVSFYNGSAAGLDGIRPEHLKELLSPAARDNGPRLLDSLTRLCNFLLKGTLNPEVCNINRGYLYGGSLCALSKKDGGIRPIAVGSTIRRLVARLECRAVRQGLAAKLQPHQLGFGTTMGCEAAIHATRLFATTGEQDSVIVKLDVRNTFNSIERDSILREAQANIPSLYPFLLQFFSSPTKLFYLDSPISSQVGAQQGDPLGPLIFSLGIHKIISTLESPLNVWYLDDGIIGGSPDFVARDIQRLFPALRDRA